MPNTQNFQTDVTQLSDLYNRYNVSRIIANKQDDLLDMEVPVEFSDELLETIVEVNLYSLADNSLIFSDFINNTNGALYTATVQYNDGTERKFLYIDFSKVVPNLGLPSGRYSITLNFFANEVGTYDNKTLKISKISTSRTEVELKLTDTTQLSTLQQFATPRITAEYIELALKQIFNQEIASPVTLPMSSVGITSASLYQNFTSGSGEQLIQYGFDVDNGSQIGINTITQNVLNSAYPLVMQVINTKIEEGYTSFTESELVEYVTNAIDEAYDIALDDEVRNPQNYRFDLI